MYKHYCALVIAALIAGCAQFPLAPGDAGQPPLTEPTAISGNAAVLQLYGTANEQRRAGQVADAEATLERALRIEPRNGHLWLGLAELAAPSQPDRARSLAERARSLAGSDAYLKGRAERLLETL